MASDTPMAELVIDSQASSSYLIPPAAWPPGAIPGSLVAIRPIDRDADQEELDGHASAVKRGKRRARDDQVLLCKLEDPAGAAQGKHGPGDRTVSGRQQWDAAAGGSKGTAVVISVSSSVAQTFSWIGPRRTRVSVTLVTDPPPSSMTASLVEFYFSNVYLGRSDMFRFTLSLVAAPLHLNERIALHSSNCRLRVAAMFNRDGQKCKSAYVDGDTKIVFRSQSSRIYVFVEISQEMAQFEEDGSMMAEKCEDFLLELFKRWENGGPKMANSPASHLVSIVLYSRVIYEDEHEAAEGPPLQRTENGLLFRDFYKVVLDLTPSPPKSVVQLVMSEMRQWQPSVLLWPSDAAKLSTRRIAFAHESSILEAANLVLNGFEEHWVGRDLQVTGLSLLGITAGTSFYESTKKELLRLTTERMLCHGFGLDIISLSKSPLHTVPLFSFESQDPVLNENAGLSPVVAVQQEGGEPMSQSTAGETNQSSTNGARSSTTVSVPDDQRDPLYYDSKHPGQERSTYYSKPLFVFCSFWGSQVDKPYRIDRFMPRARCYELFSQGVGERTPVSIALLDDDPEEEVEMGGGGSYGSSGGAAGRGARRAGFLPMNEQRREKYDKYDQAAIGTRRTRLRGVNGLPMSWSQSQLSTTAGSRLSVGSSGSSSSEAPAKPKQLEVAKTRVVGRQRSDSGRRLASARETLAVSSSSTSGATTPSAAAVEAERGRRLLGAATPSRSTSSRSKTPMAKPPRSTSVAASVRTISSAVSKAESKSSKHGATSSTPALIARLTTPQPSSPAPTSTTGNNKQGWLSFFRAAPQPSSAGPSASVVLQRVDVSANSKPGLDLLTLGAASEPTTALSGRTSNAPPSPTILAAGLPHQSPMRARPSLPTQPIAIGGKGATDQSNASPSVARRAPPASFRDQLFASANSAGSKRSRLSLGPRFNPSKPEKISTGLADQTRRWASIFPRKITEQRAVNWSSLCAPAGLPITTDYLPSPKQIASQFLEYRYSIPTTQMHTSFLLKLNRQRSHGLELVIELISQRLSKGFQVCATDETLVEMLHDVDAGLPTPVSLSLANQIHQLSYDRASRSVIVKTFRRKRTWAKNDYTYGAFIWTKGAAGWNQVDTKFAYPALLDPSDWQKIDRLVAGVDQGELPAVSRPWGTRLVLLPAESIPDQAFMVKKLGLPETSASSEKTEEDIHLQGFFVLMDLVQQAQWVPPDGEQEPLATEITTFPPTEWALKEGVRATADSKPDQLRSTPWLRRGRAASSSVASNLDAIVKRDRSQSPSKAIVAAEKPKQPPVVVMSNSTVIDVDPQGRSSRAERVVVHFDRTHNLNFAYHIELSWLASSGKVVDNAIKSWARQVAPYGLTLIEVTTRPILAGPNPFMAPLFIPLAVQPPEIEVGHGQKFYAEAKILERFGFYLDMEAEPAQSTDIVLLYAYRRWKVQHSQYIHRSGACIAAILGGSKGFAWVPNNLPQSALRKVGTQVYEDLLRFCSDEAALEKFFAEMPPPPESTIVQEG